MRKLILLCPLIASAALLQASDIKTDPLPPQLGNGSKFLSTNGIITSWQPAPVSGLVTFFFINAASAIGAPYHQMVSPGLYTPAVQSSIVTPGTVDGQIVGVFASNTGFPGQTFIPDGVFHIHVHAHKATAATSFLYADIYKRTDPGGVETLLVTTEQSPQLVNAETEYDLDTVTSTGFVLNATDRIVVKFRVHVTAGAPTITVIYDGIGALQTNSRLELPGAAVDASNFLPYVGATQNVDMNVFGLSAAYLTGQQEIRAQVVGNTVVVGPTCSVAHPCVTQLDDVGTSRTSSQTASAPVGTGTVYFYIDTAGVLTAGHNLGPGGLACTGGMTCTQPVVAFPAGSIHIATSTVTLGVFDVAGIVNWIPLAGRDNYTAGAGIIITGHSIAVDTAIYPVMVPRDILLLTGTNLDFDLLQDTSMWIKDEFPNAVPGTSAAYGNGEENWACGPTGANGNTRSNVVSANHPGILRNATASITANDGGYCILTVTTSMGLAANLGNGMTPTFWRFTYKFRLVSTANVIVRLGFGDTTTTACTNCIGLRFDTTAAGPDVNWMFETISGGVPTANQGSLGIAPNAANWMSLEVSSVGGGTIVFTLRDITAGTSTTYTNPNSNVPATALSPRFTISSVNAAAVHSLDVDYFSFLERGLTR